MSRKFFEVKGTSQCPHISIHIYPHPRFLRQFNIGRDVLSDQDALQRIWHLQASAINVFMSLRPSLSAPLLTLPCPKPPPGEEARVAGGALSEKVLNSAFYTAEKEFLSIVRSSWKHKPIYAAAGSCALVAAVRGDMLFVASGGDSRAVLGVRREGEGGVSEEASGQRPEHPPAEGRHVANQGHHSGEDG